MTELLSISPVLWRNARFKGLPSDDARLLYFYLHTCEYCNSVGCFVLWYGFPLIELGWELYRYQSAIKDLCAARLIGFDAAHDLVRIVGYLAHHPFTNPKHAAGAMRLVRALPDSPQKALLFRDIVVQRFTKHLAIDAPESDSGEPEPAASNGLPPLPRDAFDPTLIRSARKATIKPPPSPEDRLNFFADLVNSDRPLSPSTITVQTAQALVASQRVTIETLRRRGIVA